MQQLFYYSWLYASLLQENAYSHLSGFFTIWRSSFIWIHTGWACVVLVSVLVFPTSYTHTNTSSWIWNIAVKRILPRSKWKASITTGVLKLTTLWDLSGLAAFLEVTAFINCVHCILNQLHSSSLGKKKKKKPSNTIYKTLSSVVQSAELDFHCCPDFVSLKEKHILSGWQEILTMPVLWTLSIHTWKITFCFSFAMYFICTFLQDN